MKIHAILNCVRQCGDQEAQRQLSALMLLNNRLYTALLNNPPRYTDEHQWTEFIHELTDIGNQIMRFLDK